MTWRKMQEQQGANKLLWMTYSERDFKTDGAIQSKHENMIIPP